MTVGASHRDAEPVADLLTATASAIADALSDLGDWGLANTKPGQYCSDLVADEAAAAVLDRAGVGVLSEESGLRGGGSDITVVLDPVDGSTNAARGIPWYATSLCAVDAEGPLAALIVNLATRQRFDAIRGGGARRDGVPIRPSAVGDLSNSMLGFSGLPRRYFGWRQFRALGAAALDLCAVASGSIDGYVDCSPSAHGVWDYLGGQLICKEAGAEVVDADGRELCVLDVAARRTPIAAGTASLLASLVEERREW